MQTQKIALLVIGLVTRAASTAGQEANEVAVIRAAAKFVRDSIANGRIVIDPTLYRGRLGITTAVANEAASQSGATLGRVADLAQCPSTSVPGQVWNCTLPRDVTVVTFSKPVFSAGGATVTLALARSVSPGSITGSEIRLELVHRPTGQWVLRRVEAIGAS